mgnify:CR=1 FL=1
MTWIPRRWRRDPARAFARRWRWLQLDGIGVDRQPIDWLTPGDGVLAASVLVVFPAASRTVPEVASVSLWERRYGHRHHRLGQSMLDVWEVHPTLDGSGVLIVINWRLPA